MEEIEVVTDGGFTRRQGGDAPAVGEPDPMVEVDDVLLAGLHVTLFPGPVTRGPVWRRRAQAPSPRRWRG
jgi:hypothetical protein